ncbi:MAG: CDP-alcohol phosphatidyltransferase family protein, partial [Christensenellales bacterium]|nr:CDP-alcohol phosphatidyltransferase family protein [Christensenellales bacterium]
MLTKRENIWNLPNLLTLLRLALIGVFIALFASGLRLWALGTFLLAALTDFLDGRIARKYHLITDFGKLM